MYSAILVVLCILNGIPSYISVLYISCDVIILAFYSAYTLTHHKSSLNCKELLDRNNGLPFDFQLFEFP